MNINAIAMQRLYSQQIEQPEFTTPTEVVATLGAMQAQDYAGAKWSVGLRLPGSTEADIEAALAEQRIIRTWTVRGTLQFVAPQDLRWMLALVAPRLISSMARRWRELELDEPTFTQAKHVLASALQDGEQTRSALFAALQEKGISTQGQRGVHILLRASLDGLICQSVMVRNDSTFMAIDDSIPTGNMLSREEALAELARRYFTTRAPATLQDFVWWSGLTVGDARAGIDANRGELHAETIDGVIYWLPETLRPVQAEESVHLLPGFDEYLLSYRDRTASLDPAYAEVVVPGKNGIFMPTVVINGRIVGLWKRTVKKNSVIIDLNPFDTLTDAERQAIMPAAQRYGDYLGMPITVA